MDVKRVDLHDGQTTSTQRKDTNMKVTLDQVIAADALGYAAAIEQAIADAKGDPNKLTEAINTVNTVRVNVAQGKQDAADAARIERVNASKAAADALRTHILDVFTRVWKDNKFDVQLAAISVDAVKHVTFRIEREQDGTLITPMVLVGEPKKASTTSHNGNGGGGSVPMNVDGVTYESASKARDAHLTDKVGKPMSRGSIAAALSKAGHTVTD